MAIRTKSNRNPFSGLVDLVTDMNRMSERMHNLDSHEGTRARTHANAWVPLVDIAAIDDQLVIYVALPGVAEEDVEVTFNAPNLTIAGERHIQDGESEQATYYAKELNWGWFRRNISLPQGVCRDDITVTLREGVLYVTVHNYQQAQSSGRLAINNDPSQR